MSDDPVCADCLAAKKLCAAHRRNLELCSELTDFWQLISIDELDALLTKLKYDCWIHQGFKALLRNQPNKLQKHIEKIIAAINKADLLLGDEQYQSDLLELTRSEEAWSFYRTALTLPLGHLERLQDKLNKYSVASKDRSHYPLFVHKLWLALRDQSRFSYAKRSKFEIWLGSIFDEVGMTVDTEHLLNTVKDIDSEPPE